MAYGGKDDIITLPKGGEGVVQLERRREQEVVGQLMGSEFKKNLLMLSMITPL